jgi:hypothetical protein
MVSAYRPPLEPSQELLRNACKVGYLEGEIIPDGARYIGKTERVQREPKEVEGQREQPGDTDADEGDPA